MIRRFFQRLAYGFTVLFGVLTLVFFIFNLSPSDPSRLIAGQNDSEEVLQLIRKKLNLDLPIGSRYLLYINDLSPISIHGKGENSRSKWDDQSYSGLIILSGDKKELAIKWPYLRKSYISDRPVSAIISDALPGTFILAVTAIAIALIIGIALGVAAALNRDGLFDKLFLIISAIGMSGPSFFMAIIVAWIGGLLWFESISISILIVFIPLLVWLIFKTLMKSDNRKSATSALAALFFAIIYLIVNAWTTWNLPLADLSFALPGTGLNMTGSLYGVDVWEGQQLELKNLILPAITLGIRPLSVVVQLTRNSMLDVLQSDYIRTARAKGLSESRVVWVHALRNALNPVITAISGWFASLLAGAVFVEFVFGWKGLGMEIFRALDQEDLPVVMGAVLVVATIFVLINILVDLIYGLLDPRVRAKQ